MTEFLQFMIFGLPAFLIAGSVHEFMHAFTAKKLGDYTATMEGRLSLNPLAHVDPFGLILMIFARFGWMKPVPINEYNFKNPVVGTAITSIAGPFSNMVMAIVSAGIYNIMIRTLPLDNMIIMTLISFLFVFIWVNLALMLFNLIPIPPLDGYRIVRAFIPTKLRYYWEKLEDYSIYILLLLFLPITPLSGFLSRYLINGISFFTDILIP